jgi:hypothetical protein
MNNALHDGHAQFKDDTYHLEVRDSVVVQVCGFQTRWGDNVINLPNPSGRVYSASNRNEYQRKMQNVSRQKSTPEA